MEKALVTVHLGRHFRIFGQYDYKVLLEMGYEVHIAANFKDKTDEFNDPRVIKHQIDFDRNPISKNNLKAKKQLELLLKEFKFNLIQTQSPTGGAITRLVANKYRKTGTKVIYTAHGFHFFKGAKLKNWLFYYIIEKYLSFKTDVIITINEEDYNLAKKKLCANKVELIHGVGIDLTKYYPIEQNLKNELRQKYGYKETDFIIIYVGELSERKNQEFIIEATAILQSKIPHLKVLLVGEGKLKSNYIDKINKLEVSDNVILTGYRQDIKELMSIADIAISSSFQEGLPVNIMEAMATGLPLVVSNCRGNRDLVQNNENGFVYELNNINSFNKLVVKLYKDKRLKEKFKKNNKKLIEQYSLDNVKNEMLTIYTNII